MAPRERFYITTPIYYPNDRLHVGHTYTTVAADALARYHRLRGRDTWFLTGTDEHGLNIERAARAAGQEPLPYVEPIVDWIKNLWATLEISYDDFIRTTDPRHTRRVQKIFQQLYDSGDIYKGIYKGLYCANCEAYYTEDDLVAGPSGLLCPVHERPVEAVEEESYFFRLSQYGDRLLKHITANPEFVQPETRRNEVIGFINQGLEDLSVSRTSFQWGIPVPFDPEHVIYVWIDALANYITALDYPDGDAYGRFWPADVHLIGKDILRFHAVIWPAVLMALGEELPRCVYGHGWLLIDGGKMGKSRASSQVINPLDLVDKYGVDAVRYFLLREVPFGADGNYSEEALIGRINSDLANDLGNLAWRTVSMIERFHGGTVPAPHHGHDDGVLAATAEQAFRRVEEAMEAMEINQALVQIWDLVKRGNKYIDEQEPWALNRRGETDRLATVLYNVAEALRLTGVLLTPFLVNTPGRLWAQLGGEARAHAVNWTKDQRWGGLKPGSKVVKGEPLFPRLDPEEILALGRDDAAAGEEAAAGRGEPGPGKDAAAGEGPEPAKPTPAGEKAPAVGGPESGGDAPAAAEAGDGPALISFDTFMSMDLRIARVVAAEPVEGADRLLRLKVSLGTEQRQVVAGLAPQFQPDDLVGRQVVVVANLEPATIRGVKSEGMILAAESGGTFSLVGPYTDTADGSRVR